MLKKIVGLPQGVIGYTAQGKVTAGDYELILLPALEEALQARDKVRFLYELGPDFEHYTAGAIWDDAKLGLKHIGSFERIAIVSDDTWISGAVHGFGWMIPGEVRLFANSERGEAETWISEGLAG